LQKRHRVARDLLRPTRWARSQRVSHAFGPIRAEGGRRRSDPFPQDVLKPIKSIDLTIAPEIKLRRTMKASHVVLSSLILLLLGLPAEAAVYTVMAGGGGNFTTIQACSSAAVAGDTCDVFTGSYSGWTQNNSGGAGNPITFQVHAGQTATLTSGISLSGRSYITITGFTLSMSGTFVGGNGTTAHNTVSNNHGTAGTVFRINDTQGNNGSDNVISHNTVVASGTGNVVGFYLYGDRNLIDGNDISGFDGDCMDLGGTNVVVRNNYCHDVSGANSGQHIDFIQKIGATVPELAFALIEGNTFRNCTNDGGNCHMANIGESTGEGPGTDTEIWRFNYEQGIDGSGITFGGSTSSDTVPNMHAYNNTIATEAKTSNNGDCVTFNYAPGGKAFNNLCYNVTGNGASPTVFSGANTGDAGNGNLAFTTGFSGSWNSPYSQEATYAALHSRNPLFANYPTDASLQAGSPAINAGAALTAVAATDSGSGASIIVNDARFFQPGWATTQGDWIRVGASTTAQIGSINYATNTLTLTSAIARSAGEPVYLYKNSSGTVVLLGSLPTVGAFQAAGGGVPPTIPTGLKIVP
jgi:hypothetical protein